MSLKVFLRRLDINQRILDAAKKSDLKSPLQILTLSLRDIKKLTNLSVRDANILQQSTAEKILGRSFIKAIDIHENDEKKINFFTTGCPVIDDFLNGGIPTNMFLEISGESGSGKSQFCFQLSLTVQLSEEWSGLNGGVVIISTEKVPSSKRLMEMTNRLKSRFPEFKDHPFTDNIFILQCHTLEEIENCIVSKIEILMKKKLIKLIIIDSPTSIVRGDQEDSALFRSHRIYSLFNSLQYLNCKYQMAFVLVNQVVDDLSENKEDRPLSLRECKKKPALGLVWGNMVNMRLMMIRTHQIIQLFNDEEENSFKYESNIKTLHVLTSPYLSSDIFCKFIIDQDGLKGIK